MTYVAMLNTITSDAYYNFIILIFYTIKNLYINILKFLYYFYKSHNNFKKIKNKILLLVCKSVFL